MLPTPLPGGHTPVSTFLKPLDLTLVARMVSEVLIEVKRGRRRGVGLACRPGCSCALAPCVGRIDLLSIGSARRATESVPASTAVAASRTWVACRSLARSRRRGPIPTRRRANAAADCRSPVADSRCRHRQPRSLPRQPRLPPHLAELLPISRIWPVRKLERLGGKLGSSAAKLARGRAWVARARRKRAGSAPKLGRAVRQRGRAGAEIASGRGWERGCRA